jgi:hypothetical protein
MKFIDYIAGNKFSVMHQFIQNRAILLWMVSILLALTAIHLFRNVPRHRAIALKNVIGLD